MRSGRAAVIPASVFVLRELRYRGMVISNRLVIRLRLRPGFHDRGRLDQIQTYSLQPVRLHLQRLSGTIRNVDNTARYDRSAVVNPDNDRLAIVQVRDL